MTVEHTNSLPVDVGFVHTLRDAFDLAGRLGTAVCLEVNPAGQRDLATMIAAVCAAGRLALVQVRLRHRNAHHA